MRVRDSQVNDYFSGTKWNKQRERPERTTKTSQSVVTEEFTKRVEKVIKKTQPGSEEEIFLVFSKSSRIQCSCSKTTE